MKIAILGAGPSGMMAAHAASQCGHYVDIFDADPDRSRRNSGVYFLHDDCDLLLDRVEIKQIVLGAKGRSPEQISDLYSLKVYGTSSISKKVSVLQARDTPIVVGYNSQQAITRLWDLYGKQVKTLKIENLNHALSLFETYEKVISTIPARILYPGKEYRSVGTWIKVGTAPADEAFLFYNINPHCKWYRCSAMFGTFIQEYGIGFNPEPRPGYDYKQVIKVIGDGIRSDVDNLFLTGRYGAWNKKMLTHDAYYETLKWLLNG